MQGIGNWSLAPQPGGPPTPSTPPGSTGGTTVPIDAISDTQPAPSPYAPPPNVPAPIPPQQGPQMIPRPGETLAPVHSPGWYQNRGMAPGSAGNPWDRSAGWYQNRGGLPEGFSPPERGAIPPQLMQMIQQWMSQNQAGSFPNPPRSNLLIEPSANQPKTRPPVTSPFDVMGITGPMPPAQGGEAPPPNFGTPPVPPTPRGPGRRNTPPSASPFDYQGPPIPQPAMPNPAQLAPPPPPLGAQEMALQNQMQQQAQAQAALAAQQQQMALQSSLTNLGNMSPTQAQMAMLLRQQIPGLLR